MNLANMIQNEGNLNIPVVQLNSDREIISWNSTFAAMCSNEGGKLKIGTRLSALSGFLSSDRPAAHEYVTPEGRTFFFSEQSLEDGDCLFLGLDITDRLPQRSTLAADNDRFAKFLQISGCWFWEQDADLRFTFLSPEFTEITGVSTAYYIGRTRDELSSGDDWITDWDAHKKVLEQRQPFEDFRFIKHTPDSHIQYLTTSGRPQFATDGTFLGYYGTGRDITSQMTVELSGKQLAAAIEELGEAVILIDPADKVVMYNRRYAEINSALSDILAPGIHYKEIIRAMAKRGILVDAQGQEEEWIAGRIASQRLPSQVFEQQRLDGTWMQLKSQVFEDGSSITILTDITDRKNSERAMKEGEARFADFANSAADWFWEQDENLRFTFISESNRRVSGINEHEYYGKTRLEMVYGGVSKEEMAAHEAILEAREPFDNFQFTRIDKNGKRQVVSISGMPIYDENNTFRGYRGSGRDITDLVETVQKLEIASENAITANKAKSEFLSSMSHELRTPLNAVLGFAQLLKGEVDAKHDRAVELILNSGNHLLDLINQVLDFSRIESGKLELNIQPIDATEVVEDCVRSIELMANEMNIRINTNGPDLQGKRVKVDPIRFKQVLLNLLSNAVKYNVEGGNISVHFDQISEDIMRFEISDTGRGIPAELQTQLFQPFNRLGAETSEINGVGIGLVLSKRMIEAMGGSIGFSSKLGAGSKFWFTVPSIGLPSGEAPLNKVNSVMDDTAVGIDQKINILYVEDNADNRSLMEEIIARDKRYRLTTAETALEGLSLAQELSADLMLLDIHLPEMDGYELLNRLRAIPKFSDLPIIAVSAAAMTADIEKGKEASFDDYLTKPLNVRIVLETINKFTTR